MNVSNRKIVRRLSLKSMRAAKSRNLIAVLAIVLTAILFTSLFTVALSVNHSFQQANFRQAGGYGHGSFKYISWEQVEQLRDDPLIQEYGTRLFVGMPEEASFNKAHVELSYCDPNAAKWMFIDLVEGHLPTEGTREAVADSRILSLLGIEPKLGTKFSMTFNVDGSPTTETFTLCGWYEYDEAIVASHLLMPQSRAEEIFEKLGTTGEDGMTGLWVMDVMFKNALHIEQDVNIVLNNHGYQGESRQQDGYMATGVNWGYTGAQMSNSADPMTVVAIAALLLVIMLTGYLIIYNVFQISVTNDIRFYGLLKTIGTTPRQIRRMLRIQALSLSAIGIPLGLLLGYLIGIQLTPVVLSHLNGVVEDALSTSPLIFLGAAVFALITVLISCRKPGRMAAKVSPVEAVRYTEADGSKKKLRKAEKGASLPKMAWVNFGRSRRKTAVTIISLSLAVVLLNLTVTFTNGFDMDKYLNRMAADFTVADAGYFQVGGHFYYDMAVSEDTIAEIEAQGGITDGGRIYGLTTNAEEFISEEHYRNMYGNWYTPEELALAISFMERHESGMLAQDVQLYGMEAFPLSKLTVLEGDLAKVSEAGSRFIAAIYAEDDYGDAEMDSNWAKVGDTVTVRHVSEYEYYNLDTGRIYEDDENLEGENWSRRAKVYEDMDYEVAALVTIPPSISYRYYSLDEFILNAETFIEDTGADHIMLYTYDMAEGADADMEAFLQNYTETVQTQYDYESKTTYAEEFHSFRDMFTMLGAVLCFIVGLVGVLNFLNAILTGILTRRRELAVLQSIGMTGRQMKTMLVWEGLYYTLGAVVVSLVLCVATAPLLSAALGTMFWFFSYHFTILPVLVVAPIFALLGALLPLVTYRFVAKRSVVERLREAES